MGDGADKVKDQAQKVMEGMKKMPRPPSGSGKLLVAGAGLLGTGYVLLNHGLYNGKRHPEVADASVVCMMVDSRV